MRKDASLPVRLDLDEKRRLQAAAERMGVTVSALIRMLVRAFVDEYDRQGESMVLPVKCPPMTDLNVDARKVAESSASYMRRPKRDPKR